ncbi:MAG: hypothetical protein EAZ57_11130 [Cytophagales bacterium]|nr:MAG: hypothetical protein EAZ67_11790 [Cytophagales bacterium]TAF59428.1 MAG: hypothetical protein EAZ57_11130 [Cytophagales bacterium]
MDINYLIISFVFLPLAGCLLLLFFNEKAETLIANTALYAVGLTFFSLLAFVVYWGLSEKFIPLNIKELVLYESESYIFLIDFYMDFAAVTYLLVGAFLTFLIIRYSHYYMHLEPGYKRFFTVILFFYTSYNFTVLAGNFETLFAGWEMLGISSFLLVSFYRERYLPVRNAVKVFSIYRIGDVGIILAMWASHHFWHENITFSRLSDTAFVNEHIAQHNLEALFIAICILVAASAKSAQFPFSSWVARAMEGPTPSSAIFYGSLSIHFGVYLLIRTMPFWEQQTIARILIGAVGLITAIVGYQTARVQPTIKTQIAYASVAQIGLMFIEIALGFKTLALLHLVGNAFLRTYQLLVSPSVVSYLIREQFYHFVKRNDHQAFIFGKKFHYALYLLSLREFYLDFLMTSYIFRPFKKIGSQLNFITYRNVFFYFVPSYLLGWVFWFYKSALPLALLPFIPIGLGLIALLVIMRAFSERRYPVHAWLLVILGHFWIALAVIYNETFTAKELIWYLSGVVLSGFFGWLCLVYLRKRESPYFNLYQYQGHSKEYPYLTWVFLACNLGLMGFPITTTFIGEDLIFGHVHQEQLVLAFCLASSYVIGGIALIRIFARLFLGIHAKTHQEAPLQSF